MLPRLAPTAWWSGGTTCSTTNVTPTKASGPASEPWDSTAPTMRRRCRWRTPPAARRGSRRSSHQTVESVRGAVQCGEELPLVAPAQRAAHGALGPSSGDPGCGAHHPVIVTSGEVRHRHVDDGRRLGYRRRAQPASLVSELDLREPSDGADRSPTGRVLLPTGFTESHAQADSQEGPSGAIPRYVGQRRPRCHAARRRRVRKTNAPPAPTASVADHHCLERWSAGTGRRQGANVLRCYRRGGLWWPPGPWSPSWRSSLSAQWWS